MKVFFGATAGVGKTYAMIEDARAPRRKRDVVVGDVGEQAATAAPRPRVRLKD